jgi:hypothetical protein
LIGLYKDAMHIHNEMINEHNEMSNEHKLLPTWEVSRIDGWTWLGLFGNSVRICHALPPQQRMWVAYIFCGQVADDRRGGVVLDNAHRGYVTEDEAKRAVLEYLIPKLQRDLVAIDLLLEQLPQAHTEPA